MWRLDGDGPQVAPDTPGASVDYGHLGPCISLMSFCYSTEDAARPSELDAAVLDDIGWEILDAEIASQPEIYGWGAWGTYSAWGVGVGRTIQFDRLTRGEDRLLAGADAFGFGPGTNLSENPILSGTATWSGSLLGVDLGQAMLPPVFGDAQLEVSLSDLHGTAQFDNLTVFVENVGAPFRAPSLKYPIEVTGNSFSDSDNRISGGFFGPAHEEMAGVLVDRTPSGQLARGIWRQTVTLRGTAPERPYRVAEVGQDVVAHDPAVGFPGAGLPAVGLPVEELLGKGGHRTPRRAGATVPLRRFDVARDQPAGLAPGLGNCHGIDAADVGVSPAPAHNADEEVGADSRSAGLPARVRSQLRRGLCTLSLGAWQHGRAGR